MGLFSKIRDFFAGAKSWDDGLSYSRAEAEAMAHNSGENAEAFGYLLAAMDVAEGGLPTTQAEAEKMQTLLQQADAAVKDPYEHDYSMLSIELHDLVEWSLSRHLTVSWVCLVGVVITLLFFSWRQEDTAADLAQIKKVHAAIDDWKEEGDLTLTYEEAVHMNRATGRYTDSIRFGNAQTYKKVMLIEAAERRKFALQSMEEYQLKRDTATTDERRERYEESRKESEENAAEALKQFEAINKMDFDDVQEAAEEECAQWVEHHEMDANSMWKWYAFFCLLIPLYFVASMPFGYSISRTREEAALLHGIQKVGLFLSGGMLSIGAALYYTDIVTTWSDGRTTREDSGTGPLILALKVLCVVAAVAIFCIFSSLIITYSTVVGLIRNYDWKEIFHKSKKAAVVAKDAALVAADKAKELKKQHDAAQAEKKQTEEEKVE